MISTNNNNYSIQLGGVPALKLIVKAEREIAFDSPDHLMPWGTKRDNSTNSRFIRKVCKLFPQHAIPKVLDMGCSGGGFVKDCLDAGCLAVGLEGSDYSKNFRRAEWRIIPEYLFTCDITRNFEILSETTKTPAQPLQFDIVTSWEVMEHITECDVHQVMANVKKHLAPNGLWIMSIANQQEIINGVAVHQPFKPKEWWVEKLRSLNLQHQPQYVSYFNTQWVRGGRQTTRNFNLVVSHSTAQFAAIPLEPPFVRIYDRWLGSRPQRFIAGTL